MADQFQALFDAREGKPTEKEAARVLATGMAIPGTLIGIVAGLPLVPMGASYEQLLLTCGATAAGCAIVVVLATLGLYRLAGLRPLIWIFDAQIGAYLGFFFGGLLAGMLNAGWWPLLLCPVAALTFPFLVASKARNSDPPPNPCPPTSPPDQSS